MPLGALILTSIRSIASLAQQAEARILRIAADASGYLRSDTDADDVALSIIYGKGSRICLVPSLFHTCRYSRALSKKAYTLWPCANPVTYSRNGANIYVNKAHDIFYFGDREVEDFWLLDATMCETLDYVDETAISNFLDIMHGIRNIGMDWEIYSEAEWDYDDDQQCRLMWLGHFLMSNPHFRQLTLGIRNPNRGRAPLHNNFKLRDITPGTIRFHCSKVVSELARDDLVTFQELFPLRPFRWELPELRVIDLSPSSRNENSAKDLVYVRNIFL